MVSREEAHSPWELAGPAPEVETDEISIEERRFNHGGGEGCATSFCRVAGRHSPCILYWSHILALIFICIDNLGIIGPSQAEVDALRDKLVTAFEAAGLACHEETPAASVCEMLGIELNDELHCCRPTAKRYWSLRAAFL